MDVAVNDPTEVGAGESQPWIVVRENHLLLSRLSGSCADLFMQPVLDLYELDVRTLLLIHMRSSQSGPRIRPSSPTRNRRRRSRPGLLPVDASDVGGRASEPERSTLPLSRQPGSRRQTAASTAGGQADDGDVSDEIGQRTLTPHACATRRPRPTNRRPAARICGV